VNNVALAARYALRRPEMCRAQVCFFVESVGLFESTAKWGIPKSIHHYFPNSKSWGHTPFSDRPSGFSGDAGTQR
jgi:hypothetical protein